MEDPVSGESAVTGQYMEMGMPLGEVARRRDRHHDPRPNVLAEAALHVRAQGVRGALGEVPQQLAAATEQRTQKPRDGDHHVAVRDRLEHLLAEPTASGC